MNFAQLHQKTISQSFEEFHKENPAVFQYFIKYAYEIIKTKLDKGVPLEGIKTSSKLIINTIRWEVANHRLDPNYTFEGKPSSQERENSITEFKINDAYTPHYARIFAESFPKFKHIFSYRKLRSS